MVIRAALFIATTVRWQDGVYEGGAAFFFERAARCVWCGVCVRVAARWPGPAIVR